MSRSARPRVLVVDEALPYPIDSGKRIRTFELLRRLAGEFEITLVYHREGGAEPEGEAALQDAGIALLPVDRSPLKKHGLRFAFDLGRNLCLPVPYMVMAHRTRAMRENVIRAIQRLRPHVLHAEWTPLAANLPIDGDRPVCVAAHNVETLIWERYHENEERVAHRAYIAGQVRKVRRFEQHVFSAADAVIAVSEADGARICAWGGKDVRVVPNGVDPLRFEPRALSDAAEAELLFVGSLDWRPNQDAVKWFLEEIWPRIRAQRKDATFVVVGRGAPVWLVDQAQSAPGARIESNVSDVRPYVARATLSIVPLRIGGGSRLKICEALAMGRPVVSTPIGAEGLELGNGVTLADGARAFVAATLTALDNPHAMKIQAERGRARILAAHAWDVLAPLQADLWRTLATGACGFVAA